MSTNVIERTSKTAMFINFGGSALIFAGTIPIATTYAFSKFPLTETAIEVFSEDVKRTLTGFFLGAIGYVAGHHKNSMVAGALVGAFMGVHNTLYHREVGVQITNDLKNSKFVEEVICADEPYKTPSFCMPQ